MLFLLPVCPICMLLETELCCSSGENLWKAEIRKPPQCSENELLLLAFQNIPMYKALMVTLIYRAIYEIVLYLIILWEALNFLQCMPTWDVRKMQEAGLTELSYSLYYLYEGVCALFFRYSAPVASVWDAVGFSGGRKRPRWPLFSFPSMIWPVAFASHLSVLNLP